MVRLALNLFKASAAPDEGTKKRKYKGEIKNIKLSKGMQPDTIYTYEDLTYSDYYNPYSSVDGKYTPNSYGSDDLEFNQYNMNQHTADEKKKTALHELGHALGLAHSYRPNVMYEFLESYTQLGQHDIDDYNYLYP